jgi:hypothetical protein
MLESVNRNNRRRGLASVARIGCFFVLLLLPEYAGACKCLASYPVCDEVATSNLVFIGTVESIEPDFLNRWNRAHAPSLRSLNEAYLNALEHPSDVALGRLKDVYLQTFTDLSQEEKDAANKAKNTSEVTAAFNGILDRGSRVRFRVRTLFKHEDDDNDDDKGTPAKKEADDKQPKNTRVTNKEEPDGRDNDLMDVWNPFGDCGFDFQPGETYLVFANSEESTDYIFTGSCTRTRRLSEAGEDLAYLFFYKNDPKQSARLVGFATSEARSQSDFDPSHEPENIRSPVPDALIELRSDDLVRYTQSDKSGRFLFDGLPKGDYRVSAFAAGYPMYVQLLADPTKIQIKEKSCAHQILLLPNSHGK